MHDVTDSPTSHPTTATLPMETRKNGRHWLKQDGAMTTAQELWTWRAGVRQWERRGRLRTPEAMARQGYSYGQQWTPSDAKEDVDA